MCLGFLEITGNSTFILHYFAAGVFHNPYIHKSFCYVYIYIYIYTTYWLAMQYKVFHPAPHGGLASLGNKQDSKLSKAMFQDSICIITLHYNKFYLDEHAVGLNASFVLPMLIMAVN